MDTFQEVALRFGELIVGEKWKEARALLSSSLQVVTSPEELKQAVVAMTSYVTDPITAAQVITTMEEWPDKREPDVGWAYVALSGDGFSEAVTVIVSLEESCLLIRSLEWGRP